jgi:hypothetical protein
MNQRQSLCCVSAFLLGSTLALATGCGSVSSNSNPTPTPTPIPGTTPTPTPVPTPTPSPTPTPTPGPSNTAITGRVVDPSGAPVVGTVLVSLEAGGGDLHIIKQTSPDAQGNFTFNNVNVPASAIMVTARAAHDPGTPPGTPGSYYAPALLLTGQSTFDNRGDPINPGTNVGTIQLRFSAQGTLTGNVTSTDSTQKLPVPIHVTLGLLAIFTRDFDFDYPLIPPPAAFNTKPGASCPTGTACGTYQFTIPTDALEEAVFSKTGNTFAPTQSRANFVIPINPFSLLNGKPNCDGARDAFANTLTANTTNQAGPDANFTSCQ